MFFPCLDDSNDTDLCSGRPVNGLTTLKNGTTVVFRGESQTVIHPLIPPGLDWHTAIRGFLPL